MDRLIDWSIDWMIDRLIDWLIVYEVELKKLFFSRYFTGWRWEAPGICIGSGWAWPWTGPCGWSAGLASSRGDDTHRNKRDGCFWSVSCLFLRCLQNFEALYSYATVVWLTQVKFYPEFQDIEHVAGVMDEFWTLIEVRPRKIFFLLEWKKNFFFWNKKENRREKVFQLPGIAFGFSGSRETSPHNRGEHYGSRNFHHCRCPWTGPCKRGQEIVSALFFI